MADADIGATNSNLFILVLLLLLFEYFRHVSAMRKLNNRPRQTVARWE